MIENLFSIFIVSAVKSCTDYPGYTDDPLLGCYRIYPPGKPLSHADAEKLCASDGGRLVLLNSEAETLAFREKMKGTYEFILNVIHKNTREKLCVVFTLQT